MHLIINEQGVLWHKHLYFVVKNRMVCLAAQSGE